MNDGHGFKMASMQTMSVADFPLVSEVVGHPFIVPQNIYHFLSFNNNTVSSSLAMLYAIKGFYKPAIHTVIANFRVYISQKYFRVNCPWTLSIVEPPSQQK